MITEQDLRDVLTRYPDAAPLDVGGVLRGGRRRARTRRLTGTAVGVAAAVALVALTPAVPWPDRAQDQAAVVVRDPLPTVVQNAVRDARWQEDFIADDVRWVRTDTGRARGVLPVAQEPADEGLYVVQMAGRFTGTTPNFVGARTWLATYRTDMGPGGATGGALYGPDADFDLAALGEVERLSDAEVASLQAVTMDITLPDGRVVHLDPIPPNLDLAAIQRGEIPPGAEVRPAG